MVGPTAHPPEQALASRPKVHVSVTSAIQGQRGRAVRPAIFNGLSQWDGI